MHLARIEGAEGALLVEEQDIVVGVEPRRFIDDVVHTNESRLPPPRMMGVEETERRRNPRRCH